MNLTEVTSFLQNEPLTLFLLGLFLLTLVIAVSIPLGARYLFPDKTIKLRINRKGFVKYFRTNPKASLALVSISIIIISSAYLSYLANQPKIIAAGQFSKNKQTSIQYIQSNDAYNILKTGDLIILDVRSKEAFTKMHIKGAFWVRLEEIKQGYTLPEEKAVAVYSSEEKISVARQSADAIKKRYPQLEVYIIKGGFEALVAAGLTTESRVPLREM